MFDAFLLLFLGVVLGDLNDVSGNTVNVNLPIGKLSLTLMFDPATRKLIGGTFGPGVLLPKNIPFGISLTGSHTGVTSIWKYIKGLFGYTKKCSH